MTVTDSGKRTSSMLEREEYIEQAHFFRTLLERMKENVPMQELLVSVNHEILVTTRLPMAIDYLLAELKHTGGFATAMKRLDHYFTGFQTFVVAEAEDDRGRFDMRIALAVLQKECQYRAQEPTPQGVFLFQFETLCRNRLSYDAGLAAIATDPMFDSAWREWILTVRRQIGLIELADLLYVRSEYYRTRASARRDQESKQRFGVLFGEKEGRIAFANRRRDPLLLFAALQRQLGYPRVPRPEPPDSTPQLLPQLARRVERLETRLKLIEDEQRGGAIDLTKFYGRPGQPPPGAAE